MTVCTADGSVDTWVYIDDRAEPGPPRPGYLERIVNGAAHHRLPQHWIDFLSRWDPAGRPAVTPYGPVGAGVPS
jgi:hypothetical protein